MQNLKLGDEEAKKNPEQQSDPTQHRSQLKKEHNGRSQPLLKEINGVPQEQLQRNQFLKELERKTQLKKLQQAKQRMKRQEGQQQQDQQPMQQRLSKKERKKHNKAKQEEKKQQRKQKQSEEQQSQQDPAEQRRQRQLAAQLKKQKEQQERMEQMEKKIEKIVSELSSDGPPRLLRFGMSLPLFRDRVDGETYLLDGDSLLMEAASTDGWRFGQQLHLFYIAESLLRLLSDHGGSCRAVFLEDTGTVVWDGQPVMQLFRRAMQLHLPASCSVPVASDVKSCLDPEWLRLLNQQTPQFLLLHDGFDRSDEARMQLRMLAYSSLASDVSVVYSNTVHQSDLRLLGYTVKRKPGHLHYFRLLLKWKQYLQLPKRRDRKSAGVAVSAGIDDAPSGNPRLRDWLAVRTALAAVAAGASAELPSRWCLYFACLSVLTYEDRLQLVDAPDNASFDDVEMLGGPRSGRWRFRDESFGQLAAKMLAALRHLPDLSGFSDPESVADLVDGFVYRRFGARWGAPLPPVHPRAGLIRERYESYASQVSPVLQLMELPASELLVPARASQTVGRPSIRLELRPTLFPVKNRLVDEFAGQLLGRLSGSSLTLMAAGDTDEQLADQRKLFDERRHWHSGRPLRDDLDELEPPAKLGSSQLRHFNGGPSMKKNLRMFGKSLHSEAAEVVTLVNDEQQTGGESKASAAAPKVSKGFIRSEKARLRTLWANLQPKLGGLEPDQAIVKATKLTQSCRVAEILFEEPVLFVMQLRYLLWKRCCTAEAPDGCDGRLYPVLADLVHNLHKYCTEPLVRLISPELRAMIARYFVMVGFVDAAVVADVGLKRLQGVQVEIQCLCPMSYREFQLRHMGQLMQRNVRFDPDPRVTGFIPDTWQRELLDVVDRRESAVIVAPTSSGKTFCSYYCMKKVLEMSDESVVVYVAPTKALVNQVHGSIIAKLSKPTLKPGMELCGVFTRDFSYMANNCQILVTVPQCLELLLMSPRRQGWASRIRYVIFDEVHCIGTGIGGVVWEFLICLIRCPFLALSATIGNKDFFHKWLQTVKNFAHQQDKVAVRAVDGAASVRLARRLPDHAGYNVNLVTYSERYSDIRTSVYLPNSASIVEVNPCIFLNERLLRMNGMPNNLKLSPKESHELFAAATQCFQDDPVASAALRRLKPDVFFGPRPISRTQFRELDASLKQTVSDLLKDGPQSRSLDLLSTLKSSAAAQVTEDLSDFDICDGFPLLIDSLRSSGQLPALAFMSDRKGVERLAESLACYALRNIVDAKIFHTTANANSGKSQSLSKFKIGYDELASCRKEIADYAFFSLKAVSGENNRMFESLVARIDDKNVKLMFALGIGFHHAGCPPNHKRAVEMLYRCGYLQVVAATATLALGIHMPCKTVVFAGDDEFLDALNYHQMSGRSGRRGFDNMGDVVFFGVPAAKIGHLIQADMPTLKGGFPLTCAFVLRLLLLTGNATDPEAAHAKAITVLSRPFAAHQRPQMLEQLKLYFLFSAEFLRRRELINDAGVPQGLAGLVCHIGYHQPGNFILVHLLQSRALRDLCRPPRPVAAPASSSRRSPGPSRGSSWQGTRFSDDTMRQLVLILCHLFTNRPLPKSPVNGEPVVSVASYKPAAAKAGDPEDEDADVVGSVLLAPLPPAIGAAVRAYNERTVDTYINYLKCVTGCGLFKFSRRLPMSRAAPLGDGGTTVGDRFSAVSPLARLSVGSAAASSDALLRRALLGDRPDQLRRLAPLEILTDARLIPLLPNGSGLNAYALDFFVHGSVPALTRDNGIRAGDVYGLLQDFMLITKAVAIVLEQLAHDRCDPVLLAFKQLTDEYQEKFAKAFGPRRVPY